jgi:beta-lactamase regulating signal transducer with metallopeptidase domain
VTYYALCVTICLASLLVSFAVSASLGAAAEWIATRARRWSAETRARAVFACRVAPVVVSFAFTFVVVLPSFLQWEPLATSETVGWRLAGLSILTLVLIAWFVARVARVAIAGKRLAEAWTQQAGRLREYGGVPVYELPNAGSLVATIGIVKPRILVSSDVVAALTSLELEAALAHECAHVRSADNLKQLLVRSLRLPFSSGDGAWVAGREIEADLHALRSGASALELASALVKVARLRRVQRFDPCAATCLIPAGHETALADRLRRLRDLVTVEQQVAPQRVSVLAAPSAFAVALALIAFVTQPTILRFTHEVIERVV